MDRCPPEILLNILALACVDGGRTGCSLSLVSHRIHVASLPTRYHTVALWGFPRMRLFQNLLAAKSSHAPIVRHLFLVDVPELEPSCHGFSQTSFGTEMLEMAASIISALAQSIVTLSGRLRPSRHGLEQSPIIPHLPLLQDLSLSLMGPYSIVSGAHFPNLRRLHKWDGVSQKPGDIANASVITRVAPRLKEIRVSNVMPFSCLYTLNAAFKEMQLAHDDVIGELQTQDIAQTPNPKYPFVQVSLAYERLCQFWRELVRSDSTAMIPDTLQDLLQKALSGHLPKNVLVLPLCDYDIHDCLEDWLDVVEGGDGCWRIPPRKATSMLLLEREIGRPKSTIPSTNMLPSELRMMEIFTP